MKQFYVDVENEKQFIHPRFFNLDLIFDQFVSNRCKRGRRNWMILPRFFQKIYYPQNLEEMNDP